MARRTCSLSSPALTKLDAARLLAEKQLGRSVSVSEIVEFLSDFYLEVMPRLLVFPHKWKPETKRGRPPGLPNSGKIWREAKAEYRENVDALRRAEEFEAQS